MRHNMYWCLSMHPRSFSPPMSCETLLFRVFCRQGVILWFPCSVGTPILMFWTPLRRECLKTPFLNISNGMFHVFFFCYSPAPRVAALFLTRCENVLPTLRGVHFLISLVHRQVVDRSACVYAFRKMRFSPCVAFTVSFHLSMTGCLLQHVLFMRLRIVLPTLRGAHFFHDICYSLQVIKGGKFWCNFVQISLSFHHVRVYMPLLEMCGSKIYSLHIIK